MCDSHFFLKQVAVQKGLGPVWLCHMPGPTDQFTVFSPGPTTELRGKGGEQKDRERTESERKVTCTTEEC